MKNTRFAQHPSSLPLAGAMERCCVRGVSLLFTALLLACGHMSAGSAARAIKRDEKIARLVPARFGAAYAPARLPHANLPNHPFMARRGASNMHVDSFTSNTYRWSGPLGRDPEVSSRAMSFLGGECPTINFDRRGRIITVCVSARTPSLLLLDPDTLHVLARYDLPARRTPLLRIRKMMNDTSGGAYFYLDHQDRAVVGTADGAIEIIRLRTDGEGARFEREERIELADLLTLPDGSLDKITAVLPDFAGNYWFAARYGTVGLVTPDRARQRIRLSGEEIENSFSVDPEATYVVSDHALYRLERGKSGAPEIVWRQPYDRGVRRKVGQINQGSGTTPTLLGSDYVAIADNAEPRMNVVVMRRSRTAERRVVCKTAVFRPGRSATENTFVGYGRSLVVENNAGYDLFTTMREGKTSAPGITRIDVRADESGCDVV